jgi:aspartate aminotransferase
MVLAENKKRGPNQKPVYILFDQIYWMLRTDGIDHFDPVSLLPEMKPYTIFVDGISKSLAATGVRVGWGLGPANVISKMKSIIGHIGAWAPRAEQVAAAAFLNNSEALFSFLTELKEKLDKRLIPLAEGILKLGKKGYPVHAISPEGAIYLSVQFSLKGKIKPDGKVIETTQDITDYLLNKAQLAIVPFTAFGCESGTDWYRVSVGTLNDLQIEELFEKLELALSELK